MAVSIVKRPDGFFVVSDISGGYITNSGAGEAVYVIASGHGLVTGVGVYIKSKVENYNGIWSSEVANSTTIYIREYATADRVPWVKDLIDADDRPTIKRLSAHRWNCVDLPIIYKLSSTLWPTNSEDTTRDISSVTDSNGFCAVVAAADIKATGSAAALEFVKVTGCSDDDLNGVWQIIAYTNDTTFTIDIPYSAANDTDLTNNGSIQYYYNNYHAKVEVWGGLNNGHEYYAQKPYELLATLDLIPDEDNEIKVSISEILKEHIEIENNLLISTSPNNLDAFTMFFIKYAEVYDDSDGTTLTQTTPSYTSDLDTFQGMAVNAILPFKNIHSGALSDYVLTTSITTNKFPTNFAQPTVFSGQYFDLSFLWDGTNMLIFESGWYLNNVLQTTTTNYDIDCFYTGVYRVSIEADCDYDRVDVTAREVGRVPLAIPSAWTPAATPFDTATATVFTTNNIAPSSQAYTPIGRTLAIGQVLRVIITTSLNITSGGFPSINLALWNAAFSMATSNEISQTIPSAAGTNTFVLNLTVQNDGSFYLLLSGASADAGSILTITTPSFMYVIGSVVSETKTISINCDCLPALSTGFNLSWVNNLGGFDHWYFKAYADHIIDITEAEETELNIFPEWPNSYGEFADTIMKQTFRRSRKQAVIRSQNLTLAQLQAIQYIKTSPLVQIVNSIYDRRTVIVDNESFVSYKEGQKEQYTITFTITYTDDVPSQSV